LVLKDSVSGQEQLQVRVHGADSAPVLVYLPGLHGDWTLIGSFRRAVAGTVRFVELTYPRTVDWTLDDYARAIEEALAARGITSGWLLGESFGSQLVWPLLSRGRFEVKGIILAGGFVRHPFLAGVRIAHRTVGLVPVWAMGWMLKGYALLARLRYRRSPEVLADMQEFVARRTVEDREAAKHRLWLIAQNDPCAIACSATAPVYVITGFFDPVVPWHSVRRWLRKNCSALREYKIIGGSDHTILATASQVASKHVLLWMKANRS
jgi:pimeloyl-ACP methyl ester carboxylesterase